MLTDNACASFKSSGISPTPNSCRHAETALGRLRRSQLATCLALMLPVGALSNEILQTAALPSPQVSAEWSASKLPWPNAIASYGAAALQRGPRQRYLATTRTVSNCNDNGLGSLRYAASVALSDDLIDMTGLTCAKITLATGEIALNVENITLRGPGGAALWIDGQGMSRIFRHSGHGVIGIYGILLANGYVATEPSIETGGCVYSSGSIVFENSYAEACNAVQSFQNNPASTTPVRGGALAVAGYAFVQNSRLEQNRAISVRGTATGGAIYAGGDVYLIDSEICCTFAQSASFATVRGGGVFAIGNVVMSRSTVAANRADSGPPDVHSGASYGGGIYAAGFARGAQGTQITSSTIYGNVSQNVGGVEILNGNGTRYAARITNSTISENYAYGRAGGLATSTDMTVANSTIAFNTAGGSTAVAAGFQAYSIFVDLQSSIIAKNYAQAVHSDFDGTGSVVSGSNDLIMATSTAPPGTLSGDPMLGDLADNGGPTSTHALQAGSPAIGHGNNAAGLGFDQRGPGFLRVVGGVADIGAFEFGGDRIFANGFDPGG
jgi:hypothetical protein